MASVEECHTPLFYSPLRKHCQLSYIYVILISEFLKYEKICIIMLHQLDFLSHLSVLDEATSSNNLVSVLVIQKLHNNKAYSVGLALSTIWSQLSLLPVPYSKEQIQTDNYGLCQCCKALIEFTKPFVEEVIDDKENSLENEKLKDELLKL